MGVPSPSAAARPRSLNPLAVVPGHGVPHLVDPQQLPPLRRPRPGLPLRHLGVDLVGYPAVIVTLFLRRLVEDSTVDEAGYSFFPFAA